MLADFYIPGLSNDMKITVQKNHLEVQILYRSLVPKKTASYRINTKSVAAAKLPKGAASGSTVCVTNVTANWIVMIYPIRSPQVANIRVGTGEKVVNLEKMILQNLENDFFKRRAWYHFKAYEFCNLRAFGFFQFVNKIMFKRTLKI